MSGPAYPDRTEALYRRLLAVYPPGNSGASFAILDAAMVCHIAYVIDGQPYCTPTAFWREGDHLYWHGSSASQMIKAQRDGLPVCLTVAHLDALVQARSGFHHSVNYRAVMAWGTAHAITDRD